jgi:hypothetical protein
MTGISLGVINPARKVGQAVSPVGFGVAREHAS